MLRRGARTEPIAPVIGSLADEHFTDPGGKGPAAARLDHCRDLVFPADDERFDAAVAAVAHPAAQPQPGGRLQGPGAIADPLHPAGDAQKRASHWRRLTRRTLLSPRPG